MRYFRCFIFIFSLIVSFKSFANFSDAPNISSISNYQHLANKALILKDENAAFTPVDLINRVEELDFFNLSSEVPYLDFTDDIYWMKLEIKNDTNIDNRYYLELARQLTNEVALYIFNENNELIEEYSTGDELPFIDRPYVHRKFIFPVNFPAESKRTLIIKTKSDGEILKLPIKFWNIDGFNQFNSSENFFLGLYYGLLALVFILFSFFGFALRQKLYLFFVSYVFVLGMFQFSLDGFAFQYFWPNSPWMGNHAILIFAAISMLALLAYADHFFEFYLIKNWFYKMYLIFYALSGLGLICSFLEGSIYSITFPLLNALSFIFICSFFIGIYYRYQAGRKSGAAVALAFIFLWLGAIFFVLSNVNAIESEFLASNALKIGSAAEITFLSLAMAGKYRDTQIEKIEAQAEAFKRLEEITELKNDQNEKLEQQVKARTNEISQKNHILSSKNSEIINSINYAKRLQDAILPSKKLIEAVFKEAEILYLPKDIVSGDFYWLATTKTHTFFAVADCTGHGVPGAMVSVVGYNALNQCINNIKLTDPGKILDKLRYLVEHTFSANNNTVSDGMDISLCVWDNADTLKYAGAFNPLYLIRDEEIKEIKGDKQPIGKYIKNDPFKTTTIKLEKGDSIYLFSDGYADQFGGEKGKKLKYSNFKLHLLEVNKMPVKEMRNVLHKKFDLWKGNEDQVDDICVMNVRF